MVDDRHYYFDTLVSWFLCFARCGCIDTYTAGDCSNLSNRLAVDRQKTVEITNLSFYKIFLKRIF
jgi:hypothetical protein